MAEQQIRCRDECGASAETMTEATNRGWTFLQMTGSWRCGPCAHALTEAGRLIGPDRQTPDTLDPHSRGALPKETASTITPPTFRE